MASRIVDALGTPFVLADGIVQISGSVGIAFAGQTLHNAEQLLHAADLAMYQVKRRGGADHQVIDLRSTHVAESHLDLRIALSKAEVRGELRNEYQPIVRADDQDIEGIEALLRWDHPTRGPVSPNTMIPLAEQSGLIAQIGRWALEHACIDRNRESTSEDLMLSVNVSAHQLMAPRFVDTVEDILAETGSDPHRLTLEITEGALLRDTQRAHVVLDGLKGLGLLLALDDFGTGYSSLSYLKRFPVDIVKIDQSFIADLVRDESSRAIVSMTIELAHALGLTVVCEGVETREQHDVVTDMGTDSCQGFLYGRPVPMAEVGASAHGP